MTDRGPQLRLAISGQRAALPSGQLTVYHLKYAPPNPHPRTRSFIPESLIIRRDVARRRMVISQVQQFQYKSITNRSPPPHQISLTILFLCGFIYFSGVVPLTDYDLALSPPVQYHS